MTDHPKATVADALRDLARAIDDHDLPNPTHVVIDDEDTALVATVYSDDFDKWAEICPAARKVWTDERSGTVYRAARGHLCRGGVSLTVHAFEVPAPADAEPEAEQVAS